MKIHRWCKKIVKNHEKITKNWTKICEKLLKISSKILWKCDKNEKEEQKIDHKSGKNVDKWMNFDPKY